MKKFFIIPHTHWDREWYKTFEEYRVRCIDFFDDVIDTLENTDFPCFVLDGQTSVVNDYLEIKPKNKDRIKTLVASGKLKIGAWYVQPDEFIPSLESLIKNLLISKNISNEFGDEMKIGYLPDSFGQSAAMPTILKGFEIDDVIFYRGFAEECSNKNVFCWKGIDGSETVAHWLPTGYGNGMFLSGNLSDDVKIIENEVGSLKDRVANENYLLLSGSDQCFLKKQLTKVVSQLNAYYKEKNEDCVFELCGIEKYFESIRASQQTFETISGEFRFGKRSRTHNSIDATRQDIKTKNREVEALYEKVLEPSSVLTELLGGKYSQELIEKGEMYYIENHAHDSICSVCTDDVHREINLRMDKAKQIANTIVSNNKQSIYNAIRFENGKRPIVILGNDGVDGIQKIYASVSTKKPNFVIKDANENEIPFEIITQKKYNRKDEVVAFSPIPDDWYYRTDIFLLKEIAFVGYETVYIDSEIDVAPKLGSTLEKNEIENEFYKLTLNNDGNFDVFCKGSGKSFDNQFRIVDMGNAGDEYDFSPAFDDLMVFSDGCMKDCKVVIGELEQKIICNYEMFIPKTTYNSHRDEKLEKIGVTNTLTLTKFIDRIDVKTEIYNNTENHRLVVEFNCIDENSTHFAATQNGIIERTSKSELYQKSVDDKWSELNYPVYPLCGYMYLKNGLMLMSKNQLQYEMVTENNHAKLWLTLLSSVSKMGNENLKYRPGRRSGAVCETLDSQMKDKYIANYAISFMENKDKCARQYFANHLTINYPITENDGIYASEIKLIETNLEISSLKKAENGKGYIVRLINRSGKEICNEKITFNSNLFKQCQIVNLKENVFENEYITIKMKNNADMSNKNEFSGECVVAKMKNGEIITLRLN